MIRLAKLREPLSKTIQISSAAGLVGLLFHFASFYSVHTPLLTDQIAEWIMARTPSHYTVAILATLGAWAKPWATTGALACLGFFLFACRFFTGLLPIRVVVGIFAACVVDYSTGYSSLVGAFTFWLPAIAVATLVPTSPITRNLLPSRRGFLIETLMTSGVVAVAAESYFREVSLDKRAAQPVELFPFQPRLNDRSFGDGLVRNQVSTVSQFYGMSKNTVDPLVDLNSWRLKITCDGKLLRSLSFGDLLRSSREYRYITLRCISNTLKSDLMGTAQWGGMHLSQLVDRNTLPQTIVEAVFIGVEGHDDSLKLDYAFGNDCLLAIGMNGKTLSRTHGFPVRLLAPSYYGCRNVKWLSEIRFVSKPYFGTWQRLGYTKEPLIHICSHIDHMRRDGPLLQFGGVSFAGTCGIQAVRVRANQGVWSPARLEPPLSPYTWTRWIAQVAAVPESTIEVNAQNKKGVWQDLAAQNPFPNGPAGPTIVTAHT